MLRDSLSFVMTRKLWGVKRKPGRKYMSVVLQALVECANEVRRVRCAVAEKFFIKLDYDKLFVCLRYA